MVCWKLKYVVLYIGEISIFVYICQNTENQNVLCADLEIVIQRDPMVISASGRLGEMI